MVQRNLTAENNDSIMTRFRVPRPIFRILSIEAAKRDMKVTRFIIEILIDVASKVTARDEQAENNP